MRFLKSYIVDEEGSAVLEFVALALPLFIPLFLFLNQYASTSDAQSSLKTLSREMARAFVTSENDHVADQVAYEVFVKGANILGFGEEIGRGSLKYKYDCSNSPCISPDSEISVTLTDEESGVEVTAVEYVSPWA
jgi:hypothetical protein